MSAIRQSAWTGAEAIVQSLGLSHARNSPPAAVLKFSEKLPNPPPWMSPVTYTVAQPPPCTYFYPFVVSAL